MRVKDTASNRNPKSLSLEQWLPCPVSTGDDDGVMDDNDDDS